eukprot:772319-Pyramimonas_sp.AAC.1
MFGKASAQQYFFPIGKFLLGPWRRGGVAMRGGRHGNATASRHAWLSQTGWTHKLHNHNTFASIVLSMKLPCHPCPYEFQVQLTLSKPHLNT